MPALPGTDAGLARFLVLYPRSTGGGAPVVMRRTGHAGHRPDLTPAEMARLRAEFQALGMTPANAAEAADILVRMVGRLPGAECAMDRMQADMRFILATLDQIEARLAEMAEGDRRPRH